MRKPPFSVRVFDCDTHVWEPPAVWDDFLDPAHRDSARAAFRYTLDATGEATVMLNGQSAAPLGSSRLVRQAIWRPDLTGEAIAALDPRRFHPLNAGAYDPQTRLADMDALGVERSLLFPTLFAEYLPAVDDADLAYLLARAYNDWVLEFCKADPRRLFAAAILPFNAPDLAEAEARRAVALGFRACVVRPCFHGGRFINHPSYRRVWRVLERSAVAVFVHASPGGVKEGWQSTGGYVEAMGSGTGLGHLVAESIAPLLDDALALTTFCFGGHMEDFPRLKIAYAHAGAWWAPLVLERAETYLCVGAPRRDVSLEPGRLFFERPSLVQVDGWERFVAREPDRWARVGAWGSRHPNHDASTPAEAMDCFARHQLPADIVTRLMGGNVAAFLGLEPADA